MIVELNHWLSENTSLEQRGVLVDAARTLEGFLGPNVYIPIDELLYGEDADDRNFVIDGIHEALLAQFEVVYAKFGVFFDEDQIDTTHLRSLSNGLEALLAIELYEDRKSIDNIVNTSDDSQEAFIELLEEVSPNIGLALEDLIDRVESTFVDVVRSIVREPRLFEEEGVSQEENEDYMKRCKAFRGKFGRTPLVGDIVEHRGNLRLSPFITISLISDQLDTKKSKETALELYALTVYSNVKTDEIVPTVKKLIEQVCVEEGDTIGLVEAFHDLLGGHHAQA